MKNIIFDFDGVIANSLEVVHHTYLKLGESSSIEVPEDIEVFRQMYSGDYISMLDDLKIKEGDDREAFLNEFNDFYSSLAGNIKIFENINCVLEDLSKNRTIGIASNSTRNNIERILERHNLHRFIDEIVADEDLDGNIKPHPRALLLCMERLGISPENTAYVGDTTADIKAVHRAKIKKIIAVSYGFQPREELARHIPRRCIVDGPIELLWVLKNGRY